MCKLTHLSHCQVIKDKLAPLKDRLAHLGDVGVQLSSQLDPVTSAAVSNQKTELDDCANKLQSRLQQQCDRLESTMDEQSKFAEKCRVVETFLTTLPAEESRLSSLSLPVVERSLSAVKEHLVKIENVQPELTQLNQLGSELSLSDNDVGRLAELNTRWETTRADREIEEKGLEDRLSQLQHWADQCQRWTAFVTGIESEIAAQLPLCSYDSLLEEQCRTEVGFTGFVIYLAYLML